MDIEYISTQSDTVLTFSLALQARENIKTVSLFLEIYSISTQNKQISSIYNIQLDNSENINNTNEVKWAKEMDIDFNWNKIYTIPLRSTTDVTLKTFQYKFLYRLISTNKLLYKFNLCNSNLCDFCRSNIETVDHLFWECIVVQRFWSELHSFLLSINIKFSYNKETIFFGVFKKNKKCRTTHMPP